LFRFFLLSLALLFSACSDNSIVTIYDKTVLEENEKCVELIIFPPNKTIEETLKAQYTFKDNCALKFEVFTKGKIHCNSNQNSQTKAMGNMPSAYLRMEITKENKTLYTYYIDIKDEILPLHVENGFARMKEDLIILR